MSSVQELIIDAYGCTGDLSDPVRFKLALLDAVKSVGATVAETVHYQFVPHGLTVCAILKESHFILSTWPEYDLVIVNIFLCNDKMDAKKCWSILEKELSPKQIVFNSVAHRIFSLQKKAG